MVLCYLWESGSKLGKTNLIFPLSSASESIDAFSPNTADELPDLFLRSSPAITHCSQPSHLLFILSLACINFFSLYWLPSLYKLSFNLYKIPFYLNLFTNYFWFISSYFIVKISSKIVYTPCLYFFMSHFLSWTHFNSGLYQTTLKSCFFMLLHSMVNLWL
jgi:hypothetical protein